MLLMLRQFNVISRRCFVRKILVKFQKINCVTGVPSFGVGLVEWVNLPVGWGVPVGPVRLK